MAYSLCYVVKTLFIKLFLFFFPRFRDLAVVDDNKPAWELANKADGLVPIDVDTEPVQNVRDHRCICVHIFTTLDYNSIR